MNVFSYYLSGLLLSLLSQDQETIIILALLDCSELHHNVKLGQLHLSTLQKGGALPIPIATWTDFGWLHALHATKSSGLLILMYILISYYFIKSIYTILGIIYSKSISIIINCSADQKTTKKYGCPCVLLLFSYYSPNMMSSLFIYYNIPYSAFLFFGYNDLTSCSFNF